MKAAPQAPVRGRAVRAEQVIVFRIGGQLFAISSAAVQEIRGAGSLTGAAMDVTQTELRKGRHALNHRGQRPIYVLHGGTLFGLPSSQPTLVFLLRRGRAALLVDSIERALAPM